jgi:L-Lysine epsilon oxidase N-terminal
MATTYKIHPAIGVARVGDSPQGWFLGPESRTIGSAWALSSPSPGRSPTAKRNGPDRPGAAARYQRRAGDADRVEQSRATT